MYCADVLVVFLGNHATDQREFRQHVHFGHEPEAERFGHCRIVSGDESDDFPEVVPRLG